MFIFISIMILGTIFFGVSVMFGGDDHDFGDHDMDVDHGDFDADHEHGGPALISIRNLMLFAVGFGAAGAIARSYGFSMSASSFFGGLTGLLFAVVGFWLYRILHGQQSNSLVSDRSYAGRSARITIAIPVDGIGQIVAQDERGANRFIPARADSKEVIRVGDTVTVRSIVGGTATVS